MYIQIEPLHYLKKTLLINSQCIGDYILAASLIGEKIVENCIGGHLHNDLMSGSLSLNV